MQKTAPVLWTMDDLILAPSPVPINMGPETLGGAMKRCQRCDISLGHHLCPNLLCGEQHGQSAGDRCAWCRQNYEERMDVIDLTRLHDLEFEVLQRT